MTILLSPELENFINEKVNSGAYASPADLIGDSLRWLQAQEKLLEANREQLQAEIQKGIDCFARGDYTEYDETNYMNLAEEIKAEGRRRKAEKVTQK